MNWKKLCCLESSNKLKLQATIFEFVNSNGQTIFTWPSGYVLALYVINNTSLFVDKRVIELGAGTALPSVIAGKCGCLQLVITDRDDEQIQSNVNRTIIANGLRSSSRYSPLVWGCITSDIIQSSFDVILGADVFYSTEDFDNVLLTVYCMLQVNPNAVFLTTYQERR